MRALALSCLALAAIGCEQTSSPDFRPGLEFTSRAVAEGPSNAEAVGGSFQIMVSGRFGLAGGGYELRGELAQAIDGSASGYVLRVFARQVADGLTVPMSHGYTAVLTGIPPGLTSLRAEHILETPERLEQTVLETDVLVGEGSG